MMRFQVYLAASLQLLASLLSATAATVGEIKAENTPAIVYIQVETNASDFVESGTGFIVSHDGYVVTAAHIKAAPGQRIWAVIGQREGTHLPLTLRGVDIEHDTALWQLPQSATCRYAVTLSDQPVQENARILGMGFPGKDDGLTATSLNIVNLSSTADGYYKADGFLRNGYSGGPILDEDGKVIALVTSGTPTGGNNDLVPISFAVSLIRTRGVRAGVNAPVAFENTCYASCRAPEHGIERWSTEEPWATDPGEFPGGHTPEGECAASMATALSGKPGAHIDLLPGLAGQSGTVKKDILGQVHYTFHCRGTIRTGPVYLKKQSPICGLWSVQ